MADVEVKGFRELEALLKKLPDEMFAQRIVTNGLKAGGRVIAKDMQARAPVNAGKLRGRKGGGPSTEVRGQLKASITVTSSKKATKNKGQAVIAFKKPASRIAHLVEFGTKHSQPKPFIRPAIEAKGAEAIRIIGENMGKGIERTARKLYGK